MGKPTIDMKGKRIGKLVVLERTSDGQCKTSPCARWICKCDCGNICNVSGAVLRTGNKKSCGCSSEKPYFKHGQSKTRLYKVWHGIRKRCECKTDKRYESYGGRGITVCEEWLSFTNFQKWALEHGYDENEAYGVCTFDRIDNNGPYCPDNCRIVDMKTQAKNRRNTIRIELYGRKFTIPELVEITGVCGATLYDRRRRKMQIVKGDEIEKVKNYIGG